MSENLKKTVGNLPGILHKNAKSMMLRMVDSMQQAVAADPQLGPASYCSLLLKMSGNDLAREYEHALGQSLGTIKPSGVGSSSQWLSIEPLEAAAPPSVDHFSKSTEAFDRLRARATGLGVKGLGAYGKDLFVAAMKEAFDRSGIDQAEVDRLMPHGHRALDAELAKFYAKLDEL